MDIGAYPVEIKTWLHNDYILLFQFQRCWECQDNGWFLFQVCGTQDAGSLSDGASTSQWQEESSLTQHSPIHGEPQESSSVYNPVVQQVPYDDILGMEALSDTSGYARGNTETEILNRTHTEPLPSLSYEFIENVLNEVIDSFERDISQSSSTSGMAAGDVSGEHLQNDDWGNICPPGTSNQMEHIPQGSNLPSGDRCCNQSDDSDTSSSIDSNNISECEIRQSDGDQNNMLSDLCGQPAPSTAEVGHGSSGRPLISPRLGLTTHLPEDCGSGNGDMVISAVSKCEDENMEDNEVSNLAECDEGDRSSAVPVLRHKKRRGGRSRNARKGATKKQKLQYLKEFEDGEKVTECSQDKNNDVEALSTSSEMSGHENSSSHPEAVKIPIKRGVGRPKKVQTKEGGNRFENQNSETSVSDVQGCGTESYNDRSTKVRKMKDIDEGNEPENSLQASNNDVEVLSPSSEMNDYENTSSHPEVVKIQIKRGVGRPKKVQTKQGGNRFENQNPETSVSDVQGCGTKSYNDGYTRIKKVKDIDEGKEPGNSLQDSNNEVEVLSTSSEMSVHENTSPHPEVVQIQIKRGVGRPKKVQTKQGGNRFQNQNPETSVSDVQGCGTESYDGYTKIKNVKDIDEGKEPENSLQDSNSEVEVLSTLSEMTVHENTSSHPEVVQIQIKRGVGRPKKVQTKQGGNRFQNQNPETSASDVQGCGTESCNDGFTKIKKVKDIDEGNEPKNSLQASNNDVEVLSTSSEMNDYENTSSHPEVVKISIKRGVGRPKKVQTKQGGNRFENQNPETSVSDVQGCGTESCNDGFTKIKKVNNIDEGKKPENSLQDSNSEVEVLSTSSEMNVHENTSPHPEVVKISIKRGVGRPKKVHMKQGGNGFQNQNPETSLCDIKDCGSESYNNGSAKTKTTYLKDIDDEKKSEDNNNDVEVLSTSSEMDAHEKISSQPHLVKVQIKRGRGRPKKVHMKGGGERNQTPDNDNDGSAKMKTPCLKDIDDEKEPVTSLQDSNNDVEVLNFSPELNVRENTSCAPGIVLTKIKRERGRPTKLVRWGWNRLKNLRNQNKDLLYKSHLKDVTKSDQDVSTKTEPPYFEESYEGENVMSNIQGSLNSQQGLDIPLDMKDYENTTAHSNIVSGQVKRGRGRPKKEHGKSEKDRPKEQTKSSLASTSDLGTLSVDCDSKSYSFMECEESKEPAKEHKVPIERSITGCQERVLRSPYEEPAPVATSADSILVTTAEDEVTATVSEITQAPISNKEVSALTIKRGRGRPRKHPKTEQEHKITQFLDSDENKQNLKHCVKDLSIVLEQVSPETLLKQGVTVSKDIETTASESKTSCYPLKRGPGRPRKPKVDSHSEEVLRHDLNMGQSAGSHTTGTNSDGTHSRLHSTKNAANSPEPRNPKSRIHINTSVQTQLVKAIKKKIKHDRNLRQMRQLRNTSSRDTKSIESSSHEHQSGCKVASPGNHAKMDTRREEEAEPSTALPHTQVGSRSKEEQSVGRVIEHVRDGKSVVVVKKPRGRPRIHFKTERMANSNETVKRPRGRPRVHFKTERTADNNETLKRPRGRPPILFQTEGMANRVVTMKRPIGRPRIHFKTERMVDNFLALKRPRGRPRIHFKTERMANTDLNVKRPRGRPRIHFKTERIANRVVSVKRPRGRPSIHFQTERMVNNVLNFKRPRGRPRIHFKTERITNTDLSVKRPRGRPRIHFKTENTTNFCNPLVETPRGKSQKHLKTQQPVYKIKRSRGRPRKHDPLRIPHSNMESYDVELEVVKFEPGTPFACLMNESSPMSEDMRNALSGYTSCAAIDVDCHTDGDMDQSASQTGDDNDERRRGGSSSVGDISPGSVRLLGVAQVYQPHTVPVVQYGEIDQEPYAVCLNEDYAEFAGPHADNAHNGAKTNASNALCEQYRLQLETYIGENSGVNANQGMYVNEPIVIIDDAERGESDVQTYIDVAEEHAVIVNSVNDAEAPPCEVLSISGCGDTGGYPIPGPSGEESYRAFPSNVSWQEKIPNSLFQEISTRATHTVVSLFDH